MTERQETDPVTGTSTTGHAWDGIRELNTPLPRWWLWMFYVSIVWSIGYWVVYPAWPLVASYTRGTFGWASREAVSDELTKLKTQRAPMVDRLAAAPLQTILGDPQLLDFARALAKPAFAENCAPCHGSGGAGAKGYPNLNDDDWLWGGKLDDIAFTLHHGIRSTADKTRASQMPAFGRDKMLKSDEIYNVAGFVRSLSRLDTPGANIAAGEKLFAQNCAACHGDEGKGNRELGAPNLADGIWLYGSDVNAIVETINTGRGGVMPGWAGRLDEVTVKALTVYVHSLGGGER
jgi:cytochrome c oxidase cbb3-type subunit 3